MKSGLFQSLMLVVAVASAGCADRGSRFLDQELSLYRADQEEVRREDLERRYAEERVRCDELTERILDLRRKTADKEAELAGLKTRLADLAREIDQAKAKLTPLRDGPSSE